MAKSNIFVCCHCGEELGGDKFYKSDSELYYGNKLPICKDCFNRVFGNYLTTYHSSKMAMQRMCIAFDIFFSEDLFDSCDADDTDTSKVIGKYFRKLNMAQYTGKTFDTTIANGDFTLSGDRKPVKKKRATVVDQYGNEVEGEKVNPKDIEKWGVGLLPIDYENLNTHYKFLKSANTHCDSNQEIFIIDLCYAKMQQLKCVRDGDMDNFKKMGDYYNSTFQKSGLKISSESEANSDDTLGLWLSRISQFTPEEYYKNKTLYKDHDSIGEYFERFVLRPLRNLQYGSSDRDKEFYVKEVDEDDISDADSD